MPPTTVHHFHGVLESTGTQWWTDEAPSTEPPRPFPSGWADLGYTTDPEPATVFHAPAVDKNSHWFGIELTRPSDALTLTQNQHTYRAWDHDEHPDTIAARDEIARHARAEWHAAQTHLHGLLDSMCDDLGLPRSTWRDGATDEKVARGWKRQLTYLVAERYAMAILPPSMSVSYNLA